MAVSHTTCAAWRYAWALVCSYQWSLSCQGHKHHLSDFHKLRSEAAHMSLHWLDCTTELYYDSWINKSRQSILSPKRAQEITDVGLTHWCSGPSHQLNQLICRPSPYFICGWCNSLRLVNSKTMFKTHIKSFKFRMFSWHMWGNTSSYKAIYVPRIREGFKLKKVKTWWKGGLGHSISELLFFCMASESSRTALKTRQSILGSDYLTK